MRACHTLRLPTAAILKKRTNRPVSTIAPRVRRSDFWHCEKPAESSVGFLMLFFSRIKKQKNPKKKAFLPLARSGFAIPIAESNGKYEIDLLL
jgi:hypothetical protein